MSKRAGFRIFISAVTPELGSYRREVARVLRRKGLEVRDQEHFHQGGATLLEKLREYIESCDAVILLVGDRCGALATPEHAAALGSVPGFKKFCETTGQKESSYTQWELFLAKQHGKKTYTFFTDAGFLPDGANTEAAELRAGQQAYRDWIERGGEHRDTLTTKAKLIEDVLVLPFPDLGRPKPINLPYASIGTLFKGRDAFMAQLRRSLEDAASRASAIVGKTVHGLGGVGKTRLAVEYAWQNADDYTALLFVVASSPEDLRRNLAQLVGPLVLDLAEQDATEEEAKVAAALRWLQKNKGWFLILDNVDSREAAEAAEKLLAHLPGGHVLFTSRLSRWGKQIEALELDVLAADDAVAFLLERTERRRKTVADAAEARKLATEQGELALALEQAGAYIEEQRLSFAQYLAQWQSNRDKVTAWFDPQVMQYPKSLAVTWQTSVAQLSEPACRLLERLAWLAPDPIPESLLDVSVPGDDKAAEHARAALADLERYSLVTRARDEPTFTVHRLVQEVSRRSLDGAAGRAALTQALGWIADTFVGDPGDVRAWPVLDPLAPHAGAVAQHADAAAIPEPTARLMGQLGTLFYGKAVHAQAEPLMRRALAIDEVSYGPEHPSVAMRLNNLAQLLQATNRLAEAEPLMRRALAIDEASFGPEHPRVATDLSNLAVLFQATNRLAEAEPTIRRALAIDEKSFDPDHPNVAIRLNNLAQLLQDTNRLAEAEPLMRRALAIDETSFGPEHPGVARDLNNLAQLLQDTNRLAEAEPLMCRALAIDERSFGPEHPNVARDLNNLARMLLTTNRLIEAEPLMRRVISILEKVERDTGHMHPNYAASLNNLAQLLGDTNRLAEAEPLMRRALAIDEVSFGPEHPDVARDLNNLAQLLQATNRLTEAEPLSRRQVKIFLDFARRTGHEHPHLRVTFRNYAGLLRVIGKSEAEIEAEIETLAREASGTPQNG